MVKAIAGGIASGIFALSDGRCDAEPDGTGAGAPGAAALRASPGRRYGARRVTNVPQFALIVRGAFGMSSEASQRWPSSSTAAAE